MPDDPTPHGGEAFHALPDRAKIPEPKPERRADEHEGRDAPRPDGEEISHRPSLPDHPELMDADIEDEEADPVVDSGPGIADDEARELSVTQQPAV
jgi:hypothetical protein